MQAILDTGPWVALIDRSESRHTECVEWLKTFSGKIYSTEPVLTEVLYLLNFSIKAQLAAIDFVVMSVVEIMPSDIESYRESRQLMMKYSDLPMDYADATLVCLSKNTGIENIVTFDRKDFSVYRISKNRSFTLFPE
jgi:predicted nucleic acid-binding protein